MKGRTASRLVVPLTMLAFVTRLTASPQRVATRCYAAFVHPGSPVALRPSSTRAPGPSSRGIAHRPACVCHAMALGGFGVWGAKRGVSLFARPSSTTLLHMQAAASMEDSGLWADNDATFAGLGLRTELVEALTQLGFARPTRIQAATLPALLAGKDVVMGAETGSGKTLAYALPMLQKVLVDRDAWDKCPEVLVLVPNQELARQVTAVIQRITTLKDELNVPVTMLAGSAGLSQSAACAVLVATPSAILRNTNPSYLDQVHTAIVDEADMLLDGGFVADVTRILDFLCPRVSNSAVRRFAREGKTAEDAQAALEREPAQVVFAAATLPDWKGDKVKSVVRVLRKRFPEAEHIATKQLHKQSRAASHDWVDLGQGTSKDDVRAALLGVLQGERRGLRTLVFCNSVTDCKETHQFLTEAGYSGALVLHKEVPPADRAAALTKLSSLPSDDTGALNSGEWVLVCTDIAARGIDIPEVKHVVQLQFAPNAVTHLHRVGRTARAGGSGGHVTNFVDDESRAVAMAIKEEAGGDEAIAPVFSRNRGFRRRLKRHGTGKAELD